MHIPIGTAPDAEQNLSFRSRYGNSLHASPNLFNPQRLISHLTNSNGCGNV